MLISEKQIISKYICEHTRLVTDNLLTNWYWVWSLDENTPLACSVKNIAKNGWESWNLEYDGCMYFIWAHMFLNGRIATSECYVTTSCKNNLKPALSWNGYHGDVTQTQLVMDADSAILSRIVPRYIRYLW